MEFYLGVTDNTWYNYLSRISPEDVNFRQPSGDRNSRAIPPGAPHFFKLKSLSNHIGGLGFLLSHSFLPLSIAWVILGKRPVARRLQNFSGKSWAIAVAKPTDSQTPVLDALCRRPHPFLGEEDWIPAPHSDRHKLADGGYLTITPELKVEVSPRIKEEAWNGRGCYKYGGESLLYLPGDFEKRPGAAFVAWHDENVYCSWRLKVTHYHLAHA